MMIFPAAMTITAAKYDRMPRGPVRLPGEAAIWEKPLKSQSGLDCGV
jgi:hypothetical protein